MCVCVGVCESEHKRFTQQLMTQPPQRLLATSTIAEKKKKTTLPKVFMITFPLCQGFNDSPVGHGQMAVSN